MVALHYALACLSGINLGMLHLLLLLACYHVSASCHKTDFQCARGLSLQSTHVFYIMLCLLIPGAAALLVNTIDCRLLADKVAQAQGGVAGPLDF